MTHRIKSLIHAAALVACGIALAPPAGAEVNTALVAGMSGAAERALWAAASAGAGGGGAPAGVPDAGAVVEDEEEEEEVEEDADAE